MHRLHCAFCGMPAVTLLKGTAVCNNQACQVNAGLPASPPGPEEIQTPHGSGFARRVLGPNEDNTNNVRVISQGVLRQGATGLEVQSVDDVSCVLRICHSDEIGEVLDFLSNHFSKEWSREMQTRTVESADDNADGECQSIAPYKGSENQTLHCVLPTDGHSVHQNGKYTWRRFIDE